MGQPARTLRVLVHEILVLAHVSPASLVARQRIKIGTLAAVSSKRDAMHAYTSAFCLLDKL